MLGAMTMAVGCAWAAISAFCASVKPVVPMTALTPSSAHTARWASVPSGRVKSISTSAFFNPSCRLAVIGTPLATPRKAVAGVGRAADPPEEGVAPGADGRADCNVESPRENVILTGTQCLDQHAAHAARGPRHGHAAGKRRGGGCEIG